MLKIINEAEEIENSVKIEPIAADDETVEIDPDISVTDDVKDDDNLIQPELAKNACVDQVNELISNFWNLISQVNSLIATIEMHCVELDQNDLREILNSVVDESVISIGMLQKVVSLIDIKKAELLDNGFQKAEKLADNNLENTVVGDSE